jgi:hypothetical protein
MPLEWNPAFEIDADFDINNGTGIKAVQTLSMAIPMLPKLIMKQT